MTFQPDPKPVRRIVDPMAGVVKVQTQGCRVTGKSWRPNVPGGAPSHVDRFHLVGVDLGGDDVDENIIGCRHDLHMEWEHGPRGKAKVGPRIWAVLEPDEIAYVMRKKNPVFVERYYGVKVDDNGELL